MTLPLILAEVADKEFTATAVIVALLATDSFCYALARASNWLVTLAIIPAPLWVFLMVPELKDRFVRTAILRELGYGYIALSYLSGHPSLPRYRYRVQKSADPARAYA